MRHSLSHKLLRGFLSDVAFPFHLFLPRCYPLPTISPKAQIVDHDFGLLASKT